MDTVSCSPSFGLGVPCGGTQEKAQTVVVEMVEPKGKARSASPYCALLSVLGVAPGWRTEFHCGELPCVPIHTSPILRS